MILGLVSVTQNIIVKTEILNQFYRQPSSSAVNIVPKYETLIYECRIGWEQLVLRCYLHEYKGTGFN
jgi:hypothetical protein